MPLSTRRTFLAVSGVTALAGCLTPLASDERDRTTENGEIPVTAHSLPLPDDTETLADSMISGGVPKDGIPSIDDPVFIDADAAASWLDDGEPVFGVVRNDVVRAYPQRVLVWHEIVNDEFDGEPLAITYCPLTGTAQGFERGETEFGVSGQLLNSNLVMYDRATDSYWPQMLATGIQGPHDGEVLREFPVIWTTWDHWYETYPETTVLSDDTGFARDYDSDPYGSYNPLGGFYESDTLLTAPYVTIEDSPFHEKDVVLGARWPDGSLAVHKASLADAGLLEADIDGQSYVAVYDQTLDTGYIYRNTDDANIEYDNGAVLVDDESSQPAALPMERMLRYDAFWYAWAGYYPETVVLQ